MRVLDRTKLRGVLRVRSTLVRVHKWQHVLHDSWLEQRRIALRSSGRRVTDARCDPSTVRVNYTVSPSVDCNSTLGFIKVQRVHFVFIFLTWQKYIFITNPDRFSWLHLHNKSLHQKSLVLFVKLLRYSRISWSTATIWSDDHNCWPGPIKFR